MCPNLYEKMEDYGELDHTDIKKWRFHQRELQIQHLKEKDRSDQHS